MEISQEFIAVYKSIPHEKDGKARRVFSALGDSRRYSIFKFLSVQDGACVSDLAKIFEISVPAASQQLKILESSKLVIRKRVGQKICYEINRSDQLVNLISTMVRL